MSRPLGIAAAVITGVVAAGLGALGLSALAGEDAQPQGSTNADERAALAAADRFLDTYMEPDGRVARHDQGGTTVSEGQAYAMLLALALGDRERFDLAWTWTRENLQRDDKLLSTEWAGGAVKDPEPASDADLDAARALLLAAERFDDPEYRDHGLELTRAILARETVAVEGRPVLAAGPWAREAGPMLNPSYFDPRAYALLAAATRDERWKQLAESSRNLAAELVGQPPSLPPDWARIEAGAAVAAPAPDGSAPAYGFDAVRFPVRMAASCNRTDRELAASTWKLLAPATSGEHAARLTLDGRSTGEPTHAAALVGAAGAAHAARDAAAAAELLERAEAAEAANPTYYGSAWVALGRVMLTTDLLGACVGAGREPA